jgi:hypothetical protein
MKCFKYDPEPNYPIIMLFKELGHILPLHFAHQSAKTQSEIAMQKRNLKSQLKNTI